MFGFFLNVLSLAYILKLMLFSPLFRYEMNHKLHIKDTRRGEQVLKGLSDDCLRPSKVNTWPVLVDWFKSPASYTYLTPKENNNISNGVSSTSVSSTTASSSSSGEPEGGGLGGLEGNGGDVDPWRVVRKGEPMGVDELTGTWGKTKQLNTIDNTVGSVIDSVIKEETLLSIDLTYEQKERMMSSVSKIGILHRYSFSYSYFKKIYII